MPTTNGTLTPPHSQEIAATTNLGTKRKRAGSESGPQVNGAHGAHEPAADAALQSDILVVLRRYDISCIGWNLGTYSVLMLALKIRHPTVHPRLQVTGRSQTLPFERTFL